MQIVVKLKDVIIDPAKPVDLTAMPAEQAIALIKKAYGLLAANMTFEIKDGMVVITVDEKRGQDEDVARDCLARGMKQAQSGRYNKAVELFARAIKIAPEHTEARRNLAMALMHSGRLTEAKDQLVDVIRLSPQDTWAYVLLGNIFANQENDHKTAERFFQKALETDPKDTYALTNYAALKIECKDTEGARTLFEQAIALEPTKPNPYYGLATLLNDEGKGKITEALAVLDRMYDSASFDDLLLADLRKECREFYLRVSAQVAETDVAFDKMWKAVLSYRDEIAKITGTPVELVEDNNLEDATAASTPAWRGTSGKHVVRYNSLGKAVVPHIVARELEAIRMEFEARQVGKACSLRYLNGNPDRAKVIEEHVRLLAQDGIGGADARAFVAKVTDTLMSRMLFTAMDCLIENRVYVRLPEIRASQTVGLYLHSRQKRNPLDQPKVSQALPPPVRQVHETGAAAWAIFTDKVNRNASSYASDYASIPGLPLSREFADGWLNALKTFKPGDEYELVRQFVQALRLEGWLEMKPTVV
jgi:tetratricopeptide (TPR) repeat protein